MKSVITLWQVLAQELGERCDVRTTRDFQTVTSRVEHEGFSFFAITLPQYAKDFESCLARGEVTHQVFQSFSWKRGLPRFLGGFLELVFSRGDGRLLDEPDVEAIYAIRQLTMLYGKVELPASEKRKAATYEGFIQTESEVKRADLNLPAHMVERFGKVGYLLWSEVLEGVNNDIFRDLNGWDGQDPDWPYLRPKHGPGATADRLAGNRKFDLVEWPLDLEALFPYGEFAIPNWRYYYRLDRVDFQRPGTRRPARVTDVPKTMKAPRLIAKEPTAVQYMQQAVAGLLVPKIRHHKVMGQIVGFKDQPANHRLARLGSIDQSFATLDLSEASDRVSFRLVDTLVERFPLLREAIHRTRSSQVDVPGHGVITLAKYASMGSALTFPIEAMVFATIVFLAVEDVLKRPLTRRDLWSLRGKVRVYGDDIIVPAHYASAVVDWLETFGLKVNRSKSFLEGNFRESCGKEYYRGEDVSVAKVRGALVLTDEGVPAFPTQRRHALEVESLVSFRNRLYLHGAWRTAAWLDDRIYTLLKGRYPTVAVTRNTPDEEWTAKADVLARWSLVGYQTDRIDRDTQAPMVKGWKVVSKLPLSPVTGEGALVKVLIRGSRGQEPSWIDVVYPSSFDDEHLERAGRPESATLKLRETSPL